MKRDRKMDAETAATLAELAEIRLRLDTARCEFHRSADPLMVESSIHAINALNARYGYLLRRMKTAPAQVTEKKRGHGKEKKT